MIVYNTTYTVTNDDARDFVIWAHQAYMPRAVQSGHLSNGRMFRILNHHDQESECFCIQFDVEDNTALHQWYVQHGTALHRELEKLFDGRVLGFSTMMERIDE